MTTRVRIWKSPPNLECVGAAEPIALTFSIENRPRPIGCGGNPSGLAGAGTLAKYWRAHFVTKVRSTRKPRLDVNSRRPIAIYMILGQRNGD